MPRLPSSHQLVCMNFLLVTFGLRKAAQAFQCLKDSVLQTVSYAFVYLDDILVATSPEQDHMADIRTVCGRLQDFGLAVRLEKCLFGQKSKISLAIKYHRLDPSHSHLLSKSLRNFRDRSQSRVCKNFWV